MLTALGREVQVFLSDTTGKPITDEFGRHKWIERFDPQENRLKVEYFDAAGDPIAFCGHYSSSAKYDETGCLTQAIYEIPHDEDETLTKKFRLGTGAGRHVHFESQGPDGARLENDAYVLEYVMREGSQLRYLSAVENLSGGPSLAFKMRQTCEQVRPDGSYVAAVEVLPIQADWQADAQSVIRVSMSMTRSGKILQVSPPIEFSQPSLPAYPVFVGEEWEREVVNKFDNPFTGQSEPTPLDYKYRLSQVLQTQEGLKLARIDVVCPKTKKSLGPDAAMTISAGGVTLFDMDRGLLIRSEVEARVTYSIGGEEEPGARVHVTVQLSE
jgi:hypothetical protein